MLDSVLLQIIEPKTHDIKETNEDTEKFLRQVAMDIQLEI